MNIKAVEERVLHAEGTAAECIQRLEWAKANVRMLPYRIDEALAAARKAAEGAVL